MEADLTAGVKLSLIIEDEDGSELSSLSPLRGLKSQVMASEWGRRQLRYTKENECIEGRDLRCTWASAELFLS